MEFNFTPKQGTGINKLIPNATADVQEIITKLLLYDQAPRMSASQALKHPYFRELREADKFL
jgi:renal tumor antigen